MQKKGRRSRGVWENFAATRQRYTILTVVWSDCEYSPSSDDPPPMVFLLFKGKKGGKIEQDLKRMIGLPEWVQIQLQEMGSYREEDVIEALRKVLPVAASTRESCIVLLDWFSAHRTKDVMDFISSRGHVVLYHGGGCTPFDQINDTHLHALLARILIRLENQVLPFIQWINIIVFCCGMGNIGSVGHGSHRIC